MALFNYSSFGWHANVKIMHLDVHIYIYTYNL